MYYYSYVARYTIIAILIAVFYAYNAKVIKNNELPAHMVIKNFLIKINNKPKHKESKTYPNPTSNPNFRWAGCQAWPSKMNVQLFIYGSLTL